MTDCLVCDKRFPIQVFDRTKCPSCGIEHEATYDGVFLMLTPEQKRALVAVVTAERSAASPKKEVSEMPMDKEQVEKVVKRMVDVRAGSKRAAKRFDPEEVIRFPEMTGGQAERVSQHFRYMESMVIGFMSNAALAGEQPAPYREKAMRWLAFMQGALWREGAYSIAQLAAMNRSEDVPPAIVRAMQQVSVALEPLSQEDAERVVAAMLLGMPVRR